VDHKTGEVEDIAVSPDGKVVAAETSETPWPLGPLALWPCPGTRAVRRECGWTPRVFFGQEGTSLLFFLHILCRRDGPPRHAKLVGFPTEPPMTEFLSGISIVCFAASYAVALGCEASRLVFRSGVRGIVMVGFAAAGLFAHTLFLGWRAVNDSTVPLSSPFDWYLLAAWLLAAGYLWLALANPRTPVGLFLLPVVLALVGAAALASRQPFLQSPASQAWARIHGSFNLVFSVSVSLGAVAGAMWLIQAGRLARKQPPLVGFRMPSLERLTAVTHRALGIAAWTAVAGFVSGIVLNAVKLPESVPWSDPVVLRMGLVVAWLVMADGVAIAMRRRPAGDRVAAWLSVVSLAVLAGSLALGLFAPSRHGMPSAPAAREEPHAVEASP